MNESLVHRKIETLQQQVDILQRHVMEDPTQMKEELAQVFEILQTTLEELDVAEEELRQQKEELTATRQAVEAERQHYQELFEFAPDGYVVTDATGTIREVNHAAAALLNVSQDYLVGKSLAIFVGKEERKRFRTQLMRLTQRKRIQHWEIRLQPRGGVSFPALITVAAVRDSQGTLVGLHWWVQDITERKKREEALREEALRKERDRAQKYLEMAEIIFVVLAADQTVSLINRKGCEILGYTAEELTGTNWFDLCLPARHREEIRAVFRRLIAGDLESMEYYENPVVTQSGEERMIAWHNTVLRDDTGRIIGTLSSGEDITEHQRAVKALQEGDARILALLETAVDGIITIDEQGIIESFNPAAERIFGYAAAEVIGQNIRMLMPSPYREEHDRYLAHYLATGEKKIIGIGREVVGRRKDGTTFPLDLAVSEFHWSGHHRFMGIIRDITERKRLEQELLQTEKFAVIGELASGLAHEIGTPLGIISGTAEFLMMETTDPSSRKELEAIVSQTERISALMRQLLTFARPETRELERVDIHKCLEQALRLLEYRFRKEQIQVVRAFHPHPLLLRGSSNQLEQVFLNLLVNAWHAMPQGGTLTISTREQDQILVIQIQDTGQGIPPEHLSQIFEPFFTTKGSGKGTGLGLAVCQQIITRHGGSIAVESTVGKGSLFTVKLPRNREE